MKPETTPITVWTKTQYRVCKESERQMKVLTGDEFFKAQDELKLELRKMLNSNNMDWSVLNKIQIMHIISMCSANRPLEPFRILNSVSIMYDKMISKPSTK